MNILRTMHFLVLSLLPATISFGQTSVDFSPQLSLHILTSKRDYVFQTDELYASLNPQTGDFEFLVPVNALAGHHIEANRSFLTRLTHGREFVTLTVGLPKREEMTPDLSCFSLTHSINLPCLIQLGENYLVDLIFTGAPTGNGDGFIYQFSAFLSDRTLSFIISEEKILEVEIRGQGSIINGIS